MSGSSQITVIDAETLKPVILSKILRMQKEKLLQIFEDLSAYCQRYKVVSGGELVLKIRECVKSLSNTEIEVLERGLRGDLEMLIFKSITSEEKISVFSPDMRTRINYQGEIFYCLPTHRYMSEELEEAFLRWAKIRSPLSALKTVITDFMERCNYQVKNEVSGGENGHLEMRVVKNGKDKRRSVDLFIFPSIKFVPHFREEKHSLLESSEEGEEKVFVVPTEKTPAPFISFIREHDIGGRMIWVVDVAKRTVNPFIGTPKDREIEKNFEEPEYARRAVSVWMRKMHILD